MSEAAKKVLEQAWHLSDDDRKWVWERIAPDEPPSGTGVEGVPQEIIDAELAIVEERMAADELNPLPKRPWDEAMADILARLDQRRAGR